MWRGCVPSPSYAEESAQLARTRPTPHFEVQSRLLLLRHQDLADDVETLYRHVITEEGCATATFNAKLQFTNEPGGVFRSPKVEGALGCERVRTFLRAGSEELRIDEVRADVYPEVALTQTALQHSVLLFDPGLWICGVAMCPPDQI